MQVFKGLRHGVEVVAVKVLTGHQDEAGRLRFIKEINLLKQARHPHVVMYLGCCMQVGMLCPTHFPPIPLPPVPATPGCNTVKHGPS